MSYENNIGDRIIHAFATDVPNELQQCILLGPSYVQRVIHALNDRSSDLPVFNAAKLFNPRNDMTESQIPNCGLKGNC